MHDPHPSASEFIHEWIQNSFHHVLPISVHRTKHVIDLMNLFLCDMIALFGLDESEHTNAHSYRE